jgi:hypothetical protein
MASRAAGRVAEAPRRKIQKTVEKKIPIMLSATFLQLVSRGFLFRKLQVGVAFDPSTDILTLTCLRSDTDERHYNKGVALIDKIISEEIIQPPNKRERCLKLQSDFDVALEVFLFP